MSSHSKQRTSMAEAAANHVPAMAPTAAAMSPLTPQQEAFAEVVGRLLAAHLRRQSQDRARKSEPIAQTTSPPAPRHD